MEADQRIQISNDPDAWKTGARKLAFVAAAFCGVVAVLLLVNAWQIRSFDPIQSPELTAMKATLVKEPMNDKLKKEIRAMDLRLRQEVARHQVLGEQGAWMLLGGLGLFLLALKPAIHRKKLPKPQKKVISEARETQLALQAAGAVALFGALIGGALWLVVSGTSTQLNAALASAAKGGDAVEKGIPAAKAAPPVLTGYATREEMARNWPRFRGPGGLGISAYTNVPSSWKMDSGENVLWKSPVPLMGPNSPVIWENRLFLTGATAKKREVYCYDTLSGKLLWQKAMPDIPSTHPGELSVSEDSGGYGVPTGATDGRRFYVIFANGDVGALDFEGNILWTINLGTPENSYGHATSLDTFQDRLLVLFDQAEAKSGKSRLLCLEGASGKKIWESEPRPVGQTWASPILVHTPERDQIITCGSPWVVSYNPTNGVEIWRAKALYGEVTPSPIAANGIVYVAMDGEALTAWKSDGSGDVTKTHKIWSMDEGMPDICSPICDGQRIYMVNSGGTLTVVDSATGKKLYEQEFDFPSKASPSLAGDRIYLCGDKGVVVVFEAGAKYKEIARSDMGEELLASPAFADGRIYIRGTKNLFCLGTKSK